MSNRIVMLSCLLLLGSMATSQAAPMDSPDVVYIDGLPCNRACQSYMAWSRNAQPAPREQPVSEQSVQIPPNPAAHRATATRPERSKPAAQVGAAKHAAPSSTKMPRAAIAKLKSPEKTAAGPDSAQAKIGESHPASEAAPSSNAAQAKTANSSPTVEAAPSSDAAKAKIADPSPARSGAGSNENAVRAQVTAAKAMALRMTVATVAPETERKANESERSDRAEAATPGDAAKTGSTPPNDIHRRVAVLMARPEIKSVSDLTNKDIAVGNAEAASNDGIRAAITAAGATEVQFSEVQTGVIDRVISGDVPAAVLALVSPEAAEAFPEIAGFRIFKIPLSPQS
jgi:hypothetical protein